MYNITNIAPMTVKIIGATPASLSPRLLVETKINRKPNKAKIPTEFDNAPCIGVDFSPSEFTYLILDTNCPRFLPVLNGRSITLSIIITNATTIKIVVTNPVSLAIINRAAKSTPKFQAKLTNQLIVRSNLFAISNPSGRPDTLAVFGFLSFLALFAFLAFGSATATGSGAFCTALATGLALATAFATGFAFATALAFGLDSLAPPALSNSPILSSSLIHFSDSAVNFKISRTNKGFNGF